MALNLNYRSSLQISAYHFDKSPTAALFVTEAVVLGLLAPGLKFLTTLEQPPWTGLRVPTQALSTQLIWPSLLARIPSNNCISHCF